MLSIVHLLSPHFNCVSILPAQSIAYAVRMNSGMTYLWSMKRPRRRDAGQRRHCQRIRDETWRATGGPWNGRKMRPVGYWKRAEAGKRGGRSLYFSGTDWPTGD